MEENTEIIEESSEEVIETSTEDFTEDMQETVVEAETENVSDVESVVEDVVVSVSENVILMDGMSEEDNDDIESIIYSLLSEEEQTEMQTEIPFMEKPLSDYSVTEGLLVMIFVLGVVAFIYHILES